MMIKRYDALLRYQQMQVTVYELGFNKREMDQFHALQGEILYLNFKDGYTGDWPGEDLDDD